MLLMSSLFQSLTEIVYLVGVFCAIWCVWDLFSNKSIAIAWKIIITVIVLATSWIGLFVYYFVVRNNLSDKNNRSGK